ncbi:hypothetical protein O1R50_13075 [Glycomyces luteolus]|uniref:Lipoprotein n=1 Tax=Glycomyces luteolus TaxID=2670330 RepID=A0A9X3P901_9ACTN|nr:hypothetical protein [Glycomyces luteolus]MDA1360562.1 hypothetical protein [Glycomyces luteolus]
MLRKTRAAGALVAALALAAAAACSDDAKGGGGDAASDGESAEFEAPRLVDMVNESNRLLYELESAEGRIVQACLEDGGFTVHDQWQFWISEPEEQDELYGADDWGSWLPSVEEASKYGLGAWMHAEGADPDEVDEYADYKGYELESGLTGEGPEGAGMPDNSAFEALDPQEQYDWYVAYQGEAAALDEHGYLIGEEGEVASDDDEIYTGDEFAYVQPEPGGCLREMIDALYDDLRLVEDPEGSKVRGAYWHYRPVNPVDDFANAEDSQIMYDEAIAPVQVELVDCLAEHGLHGWEFDEEGSLPISDYFYELYEGTADVHDHPNLPDDAPTDFEGKKAFEIAFAVELAECGDETGFRETAEQAWADSQEAFYVSIETATYAWQEGVRAILTKAQEALQS